MTDNERDDAKKPATTEPAEGKQPTSPEGREAAPAGDRPAQDGEVGGPRGPEPTRYGDWERKGRCIDF